jgi:NAD(P)-dependent dehydrogenase (short-subunit alcohol dehydrogenase family)
MKRVLVTGCSSGIGRATAQELTRRGHKVVATARRVETLDDLDVAARLSLDVTDDAAVEACVKAAGDVEVLVNNAGFSVWGPVEKVPLADAIRLFDTNLFGAVRMVQAFLPGMRARGRGTIVNVSSATGRTGASPILGWYSSSKHALEVISEALRYEVGHLGIDVVLVEPGAIASNFPDNRVLAGMDEPPYDELARRFTEGIARSRTTTYPSETVAKVIADAIDEERPKLRWYGSPDAEAVVTSRAGVPDDVVEAGIRQRFGLEPRAHR